MAGLIITIILIVVIVSAHRKNKEKKNAQNNITQQGTTYNAVPRNSVSNNYAQHNTTASSNVKYDGTNTQYSAGSGREDYKMRLNHSSLGVISKIKTEYPGIMDDFPFNRFIDEAEEEHLERIEDTLGDAVSPTYNRESKLPGAKSIISLCGTGTWYLGLLKDNADLQAKLYWMDKFQTVLERIMREFRITSACDEAIKINEQAFDAVYKLVAKNKGLQINDMRAKDLSILEGNPDAINLVQRLRHCLNMYADLVLSDDYDNEERRELKSLDFDVRQGTTAAYYHKLVYSNKRAGIDLINLGFGHYFWDAPSWKFRDSVSRNMPVVEPASLSKGVQVLQSYLFTEDDLFHPNPTRNDTHPYSGNRMALTSQESTLATCYYHGLGVQQDYQTALSFYNRVKQISPEEAQKLLELCPQLEG